jgi:hypothetical protein
LMPVFAMGVTRVDTAVAPHYVNDIRYYRQSLGCDVTDTTQIAGPRSLVAFSRVVLWIFLVCSILVGIATVVVSTVAISSGLASGHIPLTLVAEKPLPAIATNCAGCTLAGDFSTADVTVTGLSGTVVGFAVAAAIATSLTEVALAAIVALLAWRLLRRGFFRRSLANSVSAAGVVLTIGGIVSQAGVALAGGLAASEINGGGRGYWPLAGNFDPTLVVFGVVLLLVGLAFEYGARLQKATEGLV